MKKILLLLTLIYSTVQATGQSYDARVAAYIDQFKDVAMAEQQRCGIPASITLAQGILETAAGTSELCVNAQNHFGIKCKSDWKGMTYAYTDDAKDECFRKYKDALTSYKDHSDFLKNSKRYASLFEYAVEDYHSWAKGLKRCGYASNPQYAVKLIQIVEKYNLQHYTKLALNYSPSGAQQEILAAATPHASGAYIPNEQLETYTSYGNSASGSNSGQQQPISYYTLTTNNGLKGFYAPKGDLLLEYAIKNRIRYSRLLELNDLFDQPLEADMFIYLEKKRKTGTEETYIVLPGESLLMIAQSTGMQLESLRNLNHIPPGMEPEPGSILYLQNVAPTPPNTYKAGLSNKKESVVTANVVATSDYIPTRQLNEIPEVNDEMEEVIPQSAPSQYNIAQEKAVEESFDPISTAASSVSELDKLKARLDKSVYSETEDEDNSNVAYAMAYNTSGEDVIDDPEAALRAHMQSVRSQENGSYTPQSNENKQMKVNNQLPKVATSPTTVKKTPTKTPAKTTTTAKKPVAKKPVTTQKKPTTTKKPAAKPVAKKK